jgi:hypothetical protein
MTVAAPQMDRKRKPYATSRQFVYRTIRYTCKTNTSIYTLLDVGFSNLLLWTFGGNNLDFTLDVDLGVNAATRGDENDICKLRRNKFLPRSRRRPDIMPRSGQRQSLRAASPQATARHHATLPRTLSVPAGGWRC